FNHGKAHARVDLDDVGDLRMAKDLARGADVVVADRLQESLARYGLAASDLLVENPRVLAVSMPPFGDSGPLRDLPAEDILIAAATGTSVAQYSYNRDQPVHLVMP